MNVRPLKWIVSSVAVLVVVGGIAAGCADTEPSMRALSQHPSQDFVTLQTSEGEEGVYFWGCRQSEEGLDCHRVCDYGWDDDRICAPELAGEFGRVSGPTSGVVAGKYRAMLEGDEPVEETGDVDRRGVTEKADETEADEVTEEVDDVPDDEDGEDGDAVEEDSAEADDVDDEEAAEVPDATGEEEVDEAGEDEEADEEVAQEEEEEEEEEEQEWWEDEEAERPEEWWEEDE